MLDREKRKLFPNGKMKLPVERISDTNQVGQNMSVKTAAEVTRHINTETYIRENFVHGQMLYRRMFDDGMVQIMLPTTQYSYGGVMVVAIDMRKQKMLGDALVPAQNSFTLPKVMSEEYYRQILASLRAAEKTPHTGGGGECMSVALAYENTTVDVSNDEHRIPRSLALPHAQVITSGPWIASEEAIRKTFRTRSEQKLLSNEKWFVNFMSFAESELARKHPENATSFNFKLRAESPFGYSLQISDGASSITADAKRLTEMLRIHHEIYGAYAKHAIDERDKARRTKAGHERLPISKLLIPQPSYRTYVYYEDGALRVTISPAFLAADGAIEALDISIIRSRENERMYSPAEVDTYMSELTGNIAKELAQP